MKYIPPDNSESIENDNCCDDNDYEAAFEDDDGYEII